MHAPDRGPPIERLFMMLYMSSAHAASAARAAAYATPDDRVAKARIRDAAIACIAEEGIAVTTVRKIAARAEVSPALVIHHFGSMQGLRAACDAYVAAVIRDEKSSAVSSPTFDPLAALRDSRLTTLAAYLARVLVEDSPIVDRLVDDLIADAEVYLEDGVRAGTLKPTDDPRTRAIVLALWSLGSLVLHQHLRRRTGVDLTGPGPEPSADTARYIGGVLDLMTDGVYTEAFARTARERLGAWRPSGTEEEHER